MDKIKVSLNISPFQEVTDDGGRTYHLFAGEIQRAVGGKFELSSLDLSSVLGYENGSKKYLSSEDSIALGKQFIFIKHSGYSYSDEDTIGAATATNLGVRIGSNNLSILNPNECMFFKSNGKNLAALFFTNVGGNPIAIEYLAL